MKYRKTTTLALTLGIARGFQHGFRPPAAQSFHLQKQTARWSTTGDTVTGTKFEESDETKNPERRPGHQVRGMKEVDEATAKRQERVRSHQESCQRLTWAEEIRTMMAQKSGFAVLSTFSTNEDIFGYPVGSVVGFATDDEGRPIFCFSGMSSHTKNLDKDGRAALTVTEPDFVGAADARCVLTGDIERISGKEDEALRASYLKSHPNAFWVQFGDFAMYRMTQIKDISFVGGFARAGSITADEYFKAQIDPLVDFFAPVAEHMNADHQDSLKSYVETLVGTAPVASAQMKRLDRFGFDVRVVDKESGSTGVLRVPFPEPIVDRAAVKTAFIQLSKQVQEAKEQKEQV
eukprot:CAMPEP_0197286058 /NCGR_PEP_ID=MMETSP0890-20130614/1470_1 /TAXON_ID=44058 ORGANISM="Aureoumbra lagunensis, Strain CCMP1510" /NCGR_SAMPLE_ID=MMETSP0890 /ASSEMBLY_ACC=CAM_ASM_000533 /LENGTH=347 /DNA_ID=CAMNT_0042754109 /DNA_START=49 /DNA_END=1092 /DNA_ORIENTATION=+